MKVGVEMAAHTYDQTPLLYRMRIPQDSLLWNRGHTLGLNMI